VTQACVLPVGVEPFPEPQPACDDVGRPCNLSECVSFGSRQLQLHHERLGSKCAHLEPYPDGSSAQTDTCRGQSAGRPLSTGMRLASIADKSPACAGWTAQRISTMEGAASSDRLLALILAGMRVGANRTELPPADTWTAYRESWDNISG
jgi:hypothetical protein